MKTFWMNYVEGKGAPVVKHPNFDMAKAEAERLCRKEDRPVYSLASLAVTRPMPLPTETIVLDITKEPQ